MRESIRRLLESDDGDLAPLREVAGGRPARLLVGEGGALALAPPGQSDLTDALFQLLLIVRAAQEDRTWSRLRVCANDDCRWAFYDRSKNRHGHWCDMAVCGNRLKNRELRARQRDQSRTPGHAGAER
jgi:predicted RNA-binding Zn ribbon-like protein